MIYILYIVHICTMYIGMINWPRHATIFENGQCPVCLESTKDDFVQWIGPSIYVQFFNSSKNCDGGNNFWDVSECTRSKIKTHLFSSDEIGQMGLQLFRDPYPTFPSFIVWTKRCQKKQQNVIMYQICAITVQIVLSHMIRMFDGFFPLLE